MLGQTGPVGHGLLIPAINKHTIFVSVTVDFIYGHSFFLSVLDLKLGEKNKETEKKMVGKP